MVLLYCFLIKFGVLLEKRLAWGTVYSELENWQQLCKAKQSEEIMLWYEKMFLLLVAISVFVVVARRKNTKNARVELIKDWTGDKEFVKQAKEAKEIIVFPILKSGKIEEHGWSYAAFRAYLSHCESLHPSDRDNVIAVLFQLDNNRFQLGWSCWWARPNLSWRINRFYSVGNGQWYCEIVDALLKHVVMHNITISELLQQVTKYRSKDDWKNQIILETERNFLMSLKNMRKSDEVRKRRELLEQLGAGKLDGFTFDPEKFKAGIMPCAA